MLAATVTLTLTLTVSFTTPRNFSRFEKQQPPPLPPPPPASSRSELMAGSCTMLTVVLTTSRSAGWSLLVAKMCELNFCWAPGWGGAMTTALPWVSRNRQAIAMYMCRHLAATPRRSSWLPGCRTGPGVLPLSATLREEGAWDGVAADGIVGVGREALAQRTRRALLLSDRLLWVMTSHGRGVFSRHQERTAAALEKGVPRCSRRHRGRVYGPLPYIEGVFAEALSFSRPAVVVPETGVVTRGGCRRRQSIALGFGRVRESLPATMMLSVPLLALLGSESRWDRLCIV